ncbi:hypothetical protein E0H89_00540 [Acinetobacter sp. ANC 3781]|uniref:hypothetical protein n=1 Tax=Acinetobacter sp. ANC 3781 TaxID=2529835 RepID=UPI00103B6CA0|nr:hypothetical protein [Acinetobacter sp. ANC 3781]TCB80152.1 hypothetical protein E0H89_00540 [Acinetobacter sp. ANC 3781]
MTEQTTETQTQDENTEQTQTSVLAGDQTQGDETQTQTTEETTAAPGAPESIDGYEVNVEGFNYDEFKAIPENQEFLERAREAGLDSKSLNFLLGEYNQLIPSLMEGNAALDNEACVSAMKETWGADTDTNFGFAKAAANNAIQNGILTPEEVNSPEFGNNPLVLKMAAYFGQQLNEDTPPSNTQQSGAVDVQSLMASEAYLNDKHPDHKSVSAQVERYYSKTYK